VEIYGTRPTPIVKDVISALNICVTNDYGYVPLVVNTSRSFLHSWLITGFATGFTPIFSVVRVTRSLVLCVCFVDRCLSFCTFSFWPLCCLFFFDIQILITSLWYLQTLLTCRQFLQVKKKWSKKKLNLIVGQTININCALKDIINEMQYTNNVERKKK
jgi:hypothetical protein